MGAIDELQTVPAKIKPDEVKLARQVIGNFETGGDLTQYKDEYQDELRKMIDAKIAGEEIVAPTEEAPPKVVNLMDALRQSLERVSTEKKRPARVVEHKPARAAAKAPVKKRARG
jgi:DNA end-binding protein Ku